MIKLLADLAEILQVEDLLHCTFHPLRNLARMTMPEEQFHAKFGKDFCHGADRDARRQEARCRTRSNTLFPVMPAFFGARQVEEQRDVPQVGHQAAHQRGDARGLYGRVRRKLVAKLGLTLPALVAQAAA